MSETLESNYGRIGLFGGSFDPIHLGHLLVARAAMEELDLDRLFFIPAARSPFKPDSKPVNVDERVRLIRLALAGCAQYEIDLQEVERGGVSYTIDTVTGFARQFERAEIYFLIGDDHVATLPKWRGADKLAQLATFAVIPRPGSGEHTLPAPFHGVRLRGWPLEISSSEIRDRIRLGLPIRHLVPDTVAEAIANNRLYL